MNDRLVLNAAVPDIPQTIYFVAGTASSPEDERERIVPIDFSNVVRSPCLRSRLSPFTNSRLIPLPDVDPCALKIYAHWLENRGLSIFKPGMIDLLGFDPARISPESLPWQDSVKLIKAHTLGSLFEDVSFQDDIMLELKRWVDPEQGPDVDVLALVFTESAEIATPGLKSILVDKMFRINIGLDDVVQRFVEKVIDSRRVLRGPSIYHTQDDNGMSSSKSAGTGMSSSSYSVNETVGTEQIHPSIVEEFMGSAFQKHKDSERRNKCSITSLPELWSSSARSGLPQDFGDISQEGNTLPTQQEDSLSIPQSSTISRHVSTDFSVLKYGENEDIVPRAQKVISIQRPFTAGLPSETKVLQVSSASNNDVLETVLEPSRSRTAIPLVHHFQEPVPFPSADNLTSTRIHSMGQAVTVKRKPTMNFAWPISRFSVPAVLKTQSSQSLITVSARPSTKRKPAPKQGLEFLKRYPDAVGLRFEVVKNKPLPLLPIELLGTPITPDELLSERPKSARSAIPPKT